MFKVLFNAQRFVLCFLLVQIGVLFLISNAFSQKETPTQTIRGGIIDMDSRMPLPGASIVLIGSSPPIGAVADVDGEFRIEKVEVGRHSLQVSYLGYKTSNIPNIYLSSAKELVLLVELEEKVYESKEVVITASVDKTKALNQMAVVSARTFSVDETSRFAGSFRDPARLVANFAGVTASGDQRNDIIIRGNSPLGVLWRVEGLDIPSPNHFTQQGANGGPISILNNNLITNSDFFTGAYPAEYGNSLSGVFDIKLRRGNNEKHEFIGQLGMNGAELSAEGPLSKKHRGSYLLSYRYSTMQIFDKMGISFGTAGIPKYQDMSYKFHLPTEKLGVFSLFGLGGTSNIRIIGAEQEAIEKQAGLKEDKNSDFGTDMVASGLSHTYYYDNNLFHKLIIGFSGQRRRVSVDSLPLNGDPPFITYSDSTQSGKTTISYFLNKKVNSKHTIRLGGIADWYQLDLKEKYYDDKVDLHIPLRDFGGATALFQGYLNWRFKPNDFLLFTSGIHMQYFAFNHSTSLEPRIGLSWTFAPKKSISLGYGHHSQMQQLETYFYESRDSLGATIRTNEGLDFTYTHHLIASYDWAFLSNCRMKLETYYQALYNVPVYGTSSSSFSAINLGAEYGLLPNLDSLANSGTGINYGIEMTLEKFFSNYYYFLFTSSLFESKYKGSDGIIRNTVFNGNFVVNVLAGKEFVVNKLNVFSIDAKVTTSGGNRYTPIDMDASKLFGEEVLDDNLAFSEQFDTYFRADLRLGFKRNAKKVAHEWAFDIQNIFNTKNILLQLYDEESNQIEFAYQLGIFPVVLYRIEF